MEELKDNNKVPVKEIIKQQNAREHLANERTLLAWIRTSIGIMVFGFVVFKFSLFVKQISHLLDKNVAVPAQQGYSSIIGIMLVAVGSVVLLLSYVKYKQTEKQLNNETFQSSSKLAFVVTLIIFIVSILLILYLMESTNRYL